MKKKFAIVCLSMCLLTPAYSFSIGSFFEDLVDDIGTVLRQCAPKVIDELIQMKVSMAPHIQAFKFLSHTVLPDDYETMFDMAMKNLSVSKFFYPGGSVGDNVDASDIVRIMLRENMVFLDRSDDFQKNDYEFSLPIKIQNTEDVLVRVLATVPMQTPGGSQDVGAYVGSEKLQVTLTNKNETLILRKLSLNTDGHGNLSTNLKLTNAELRSLGEDYVLKLEDISHGGGFKNPKVSLSVFSSRGFPTYKVTIHTGDKGSTNDGPGTDSRVWISMFGDDGRMILNYRLDDEKDNFEKNQVDQFLVKSPVLGNIRSIWVRTDGTKESANWHLQKVTIEETTGEFRKWEFNPKTILSPLNSFTYASANPSKRPYRLTVKTGDVEGAGTDSKIFISFVGSSGVMFGPLQLNNAEDNFERAKIDFFGVRIPDLENLKLVRIESDLSGENAPWFLKTVKITNTETNQSWEITCNKWLDNQHGNYCEGIPLLIN